jgi:hypothetical protein
LTRYLTTGTFAALARRSTLTITDDEPGYGAKSDFA